MIKLTTIIFLISVIACKQQNPFVKSRLRTAEQFIDCLQKNQPDSLLQYSFKGASQNIDDKEFREMNVTDAHDLIKKYGLPAKNKWEIKYDPKNYFQRLTIVIPFSKGGEKISLFFPPPEIGDKVYYFEVGPINLDIEEVIKNAPVPRNNSVLDTVK